MSLIKKDFLFHNDISRIILDGFTFSQLKIDATELYEIISNLLLNKENLFYYCTQRASCRTLKETKKYVKRLIKDNILRAEIETILKNLKWDKYSIDINSTKFSGDLGEYLMNIIIETFDISATLISKVSLKTSPSMPSFGNDNIFYDYNSNILYFGEAKFYTDTKKALKESFDSINNHLKNLIEISFIKNHTSTFIAENDRTLKKIEKRLEIVDAAKISCTSITFIMSDDHYEEVDYQKDLLDFASANAEKNTYINESIIVFLPIISKNEFLKYFENKVLAL